MRCYECGYQNEAGVKVCIKCGTKLEEVEASAPAPETPKPAATEQNAPQGGAKTIRGKVADAPSWDKPSSTPSFNDGLSVSSNIIKCPQCDFYPLPSAPSPSNPCPNCGFGGATVSTSESKTVRVDSIDLGGDDSPTGFKLIDENRGTELSFSGSNVDVNRDSIESNNNSISSDVHASFSLENGQLFVEDKSSNGSTFVKIEGKMQVPSGSKIVIGNRVFTLKID